MSLPNAAKPKCIFFDWNDTLAKPGTRGIFIYDRDPQTRLATLKPFALGLLSYLAAAHYKIGLITNTNYNAQHFRQALTDTGLTQFIDPELVFISSESHYCKKPCSQIFRAALAASGCNPAETIFVGDACYADVYGASNLGIAVIYVGSGYCPFPHRQIRELDEIVTIV